MFGGYSSAIIRRKFETFDRDPLGTLKLHSLRLTRSLLAGWSKHRLNEASVLQPIMEFVSRRPSTAIPPDYSDLWFLYRTAREKKPRVILEFGSGCSTIVFAKAIADNGRGQLVSIDAVHSWAESTAASLPGSLRKYCEIIVRPVVEIDYDGTPAFRHANMPPVVPDYIYLDGPPLTDRIQVAVDVLDMEERLPSGVFMVVDGRQTNTEFLSKRLKKSYRLTRRLVFDNSVLVATP